MYKADLVLIEEQLKSKAELELVEKKASIKDMTKLLDKKTPLKIFEQTVSVIIEELKTKASETTLEFAYNNLIKANIQILLRWTGSELNNFNLIPWDSEVANQSKNNFTNHLHNIYIKDEGYYKIDAMVVCEKQN